MGQRRRPHDLPLDRTQVTFVRRDLDEAGANPGVTNPLLRLPRPVVGERFRRPLHRVWRQERVLVQAGVRDDVEAARLRQPLQQHRVPAEELRAAITERLAAGLPQRRQVGKHYLEHLLLIPAVRPRLVGADEVAHHVLVDQRHPQLGRCDRAGDGLDRRHRVLLSG